MSEKTKSVRIWLFCLFVLLSGKDTSQLKTILQIQLFGWKAFDRFYLELLWAIFKWSILQGERIIIKTEIWNGNFVQDYQYNTWRLNSWRCFNLVLECADLSRFHPDVPILLPLSALESWRVEWIMLGFDLWFQSLDTAKLQLFKYSLASLSELGRKQRGKPYKVALVLIFSDDSNNNHKFS